MEHMGIYWKHMGYFGVSIPFDNPTGLSDFRRLRPLLPSHAGPSCNATLEVRGASRCCGASDGKNAGEALRQPRRVSTVIPGMD